MSWGIIPQWFEKYHKKGYRLIENSTFLYLEKNGKTIATFINTISAKFIIKEIKNDSKGRA